MVKPAVPQNRWPWTSKHHLLILCENLILNSVFFGGKQTEKWRLVERLCCNDLAWFSIRFVLSPTYAGRVVMHYCHSVVILELWRVENDKIWGILWPAVTSVRCGRKEMVMNDSFFLGVWLNDWQKTRATEPWSPLMHSVCVRRACVHLLWVFVCGSLTHSGPPSGSHGDGRY